jgi:Bacterial Ig domain
MTTTPTNMPTETPTATPAAVADSFNFVHDRALNVDAAGVLVNDTVPPGYGALFLTGASHGHFVAWEEDGSFNYEPDYRYVGPDSFTYQLVPLSPSGSSGGTNAGATTATVTIAVTNQPPTPKDDHYSTPQDTPLLVPAPGVLSNDSDPDGDRVRAYDFSLPSHGHLAELNIFTGKLSYTSNVGFVGTDTITYVATDEETYFATAVIRIDVLGPTATTPTAMNTPPATATSTTTSTLTIPPTNTATNTPTSTPSATSTATPTKTPTRTPTRTPTKKPTKTHTRTPTVTPASP